MQPGIKRVALLGGGVIGAGWAARMLLHGIDVCVFDPSARVEARMNAVIENAARAWRKMVTVAAAAIFCAVMMQKRVNPLQKLAFARARVYIPSSAGA